MAGLFFSSFANIVEFNDNVLSFSVLTPKFDKYKLSVPNPVIPDEKKLSILFLIPSITVSEARGPGLEDGDPLKVFSLKTFLITFTASTNV